MKKRKNFRFHESESFDIILDDIKLERVNNTKFLGVIIDENLTWKNHIDEIWNYNSQNENPQKVIVKFTHFVFCFWNNPKAFMIDMSLETPRIKSDFAAKCDPKKLKQYLV